MKRLVMTALSTALAVSCTGDRPAPGQAEGSAAPPPARAASPPPAGSEAVAPTPVASKSSAETGELPPGVFRLKRVDIVDPSGFEKPMVATTLLVPADWQAEGKIVWGGTPSCGAGYNIQFQAAAPDGRSGMQIIPTEQWQWSSMGPVPGAGCPTLRLTSTREYIENLLGRSRPDARILEYRRREDIEQPFKQLEQVVPMPMGESRTWVEAGEAVIGYEVEGVEMREIVAALVIFSRMTTPPQMGMAGTDFMSGVSMPGFAWRTPAGELDRELAETVRKSGRENPEWAARIAQHNAKIAGINAAGARERARITAETNEEIRQMQADSWRQQSESFDRNSRETSEMIRGVETYDDPYHGGTVQLDSTYERAWQMPDGTYLLSNDALFEPGVDLGVDATPLQVTE